MGKWLWVILLAALALFGCGGSRHDPGLTNPGTPPPTASISGTVTSKGAPLKGATVTLWITNNNEITATATTDAEGQYSFDGISTTGDATAEYQLWAMKGGYSFYPSVGSGAKVIRADHTGEFESDDGPTGRAVPIDLTVIDWMATAGNTVAGANFAAYDGSDSLVNIAATGQTESYAPGDDGDLKKGVAWPEARFKDNGDGSVTDGLTGLTWLKDAGCFAPAVWAAALKDANGLASGKCGLTDGSAAGTWRLPNLVELESLIDASASSPALTPGNPFRNVSNEIYWTSTVYIGGEEGTQNAWVIRMTDGSYWNDGKLNLMASSANGVWAVKGEGSGEARLQATGLFGGFGAGDDGTLQKGVRLTYPRFIENGDGTVTDAMTGLTWLKVANCIQGDWATAVAAVNKLANGQCGLKDGSKAGQWRMPNRKEMQSMADRHQNNESDYLNFTFHNPDGSVFQEAILSGFIGYQFYWTSTTDAADAEEAWTVFSCDFGVYDRDKEETGYTLAVR